MPRHRWWIVGSVVVLGVVLVAALVGVAYARRIAPPYPTTEGEPYQIALATDGCPVIAEPQHFVDAPGQLVPPDPFDVTLCTIPTEPSWPGAISQTEPRIRVLRAGAADFAALLNSLPDRNEAFRQWQRRFSGWWPDAPPEEVCLAIGHMYGYSYVLHYVDRPPVVVFSSCATQGLTTGTRTRVDPTMKRPHVLDTFLELYAAEPR